LLLRESRLVGNGLVLGCEGRCVRKGFETTGDN